MIQLKLFSVFNKDIKNSNLSLQTINVLKKRKNQLCISLKNLNDRTKILYLNFNLYFLSLK